ncbi:hypothetical protein ACPWL5_005258, partial [Escherichia coli]
KKIPLCQGAVKVNFLMMIVVLRCCYARSICRRNTAKTTPMTGQDVRLSDRARALRQTLPGQGCAPTPRQRLKEREKIPRPVHRFLMRKFAVLTRSPF